jgi:hypothetical protein
MPPSMKADFYYQKLFSSGEMNELVRNMPTAFKRLKLSTIQDLLTQLYLQYKR